MINFEKFSFNMCFKYLIYLCFFFSAPQFYNFNPIPGYADVGPKNEMIIGRLSLATYFYYLCGNGICGRKKVKTGKSKVLHYNNTNL